MYRIYIQQRHTWLQYLFARKFTACYADSEQEAKSICRYENANRTKKEKRIGLRYRYEESFLIPHTGSK